MPLYYVTNSDSDGPICHQGPLLLAAGLSRDAGQRASGMTISGVIDPGLYLCMVVSDVNITKATRIEGITMVTGVRASLW